MKKYLKIGLGVVVLAVVGYFAFLYMTPRGLAERVMMGIKSGKIYYAEGMFGSQGVPFFPGEIRTNRWLESISAESIDSFEMKTIDLEPRFFQIPEDALKYTLISSWSDKNKEYGQAQGLNKAHYNDPAYSYYKDLYKTYNEFKAAQIKLYQDNLKFEVLPDSSYLRYYEKIPTRGYVYKVTTMDGIHRLTVVLMQMEGNMWKLAGLLLED